jgi:hypothetical protein
VAVVAKATASKGLHVRGNRLVDGHGRLVRLHGVNRSGTEYACVQGWGMSDGPNTAATVKAMVAWGVNAVRVPINEQCWLGINKIEPKYSGTRYRRAITRYVKLLQRHGMYVELSLMWAAPGEYPATYQAGGPNRDHSPALWRSLARTFRNHRDVILAPWGETIVDGDCFLRGGVCAATFGPNNEQYPVAGMQQAVDVMRRAGYRGPIAIPGIDYANNLTHWLSHQPRDPLKQLVAEAHVYGGNVCADPACFDRTLAPIARRVPLIFGEFGETYDDSSCASANTAQMMTWADKHNVGYMAWTWNTWDTCASLISDFDGTPRGEFGNYIRDRYVRTKAKARRRGR